MSQNSILELLSVTSNAVKALDKTNSSKSSGSGGGTPRIRIERENAENHPPVNDQDVQDNSRSSADSGVGKTATQSNQARSIKETSGDLHDSDDSTTASDVLIRSTLVDENPAVQPAVLNSSASSQGSRCKELDNFNVADARKVKVSKKHLREIVSPRDSYDNSRQVVSVFAHTECETNLNVNNNNQKSSYKPENGKVVNGSFPNKAFPNASVKDTSSRSDKNSSKMLAEQKKTHSQGVDSVVYTVQRHEHNGKELLSNKQQTKTGKPDQVPQHLTHFPYKVSRQGNSAKEQVLVESADLAEDWEEQSVSSSQPEIVTVEERIVNVSSQAPLPSDYEDSVSQASAVDVVSAANRPLKPQSFPNPRPKHQGPGLKQGALMQGSAMPKTGKGEEVQISKFSLTEKQREVREALSKRGNPSKPVKRVVQPKMVHSGSGLAEEDLNRNNNMDMGEGSSATGGGGGAGTVESITAAVAASAAVAATQPFLKMQQDLENKMQTLLAEMDRVQKQVVGGTGTGAGGAEPKAGSQQQGSNPRLQHLEQQMTERRLEHLESLQSQQMQLQAQLLSMSRDMSQTRQPHAAAAATTTSTFHPTYFPTSASLTAAPSKPHYSRALIERELMRGRLQGEERGRSRDQWHVPDPVKVPEMSESALDTPNPRSRPPRPAQFGGAKGGLLQEILAAEPSPQLNTTFSLPHSDVHTARTGRSRREDGASPVEKARKLVHDLSNLEDQTAESIWSDVHTKNPSKMRVEEPAPLEYYLRVRDTNSTPYSKLGKSHHHHTRSRSSSPTKPTPGTSAASSQAPVPDRYGEARSVLNSVVSERETLEKNLEMMLRSRQDADVFALLGGVGGDRPEMTRIHKMVEKRISSLKEEVKREVEWDLQHNVAPSKSASVQDLSRKPAQGVGFKTAVGFGSGAPRMSRIDSGLHKSRSVPDTVSKEGKGKRIIKAKPAPKKSKIPYEDEVAMTQIYGKAQYQKGRTTVRDPYLHFQNQAKQRTSRLPSPKRADNVMTVKSSKIQTQSSSTSAPTAGPSSVGHGEGRAPRQYYFSPTRGYVPLTSSTAPVVGQLVPMAIPLGRPRMDPGLALAPEEQSVSVPPQPSGSRRPAVTAATNVAVVAINTDPESQRHERVPELGKQVLPPVDIDSLSPASSPRGSDIETKDPHKLRNAGFVQTFHYQESEQEDDDDDEEGDRTLTDEEEQQGTGLSLPGYHQPTPSPDLTTQPRIPDRASQASRPLEGATQLREQGEVPWEERCDELAEDLRRRDVLHNKAKYWLEQELMARLLMKMYPVMAARAVEEPEPQDDVADGTDSIPDDESLLVGDTIGQRGLQLFVDAGQPVNNTLVNALVREVIAEKVGGMLGRRQERDSAISSAVAAKTSARQTAAAEGATAVVEGMTEEREFVRPSRQADRVPTPQPTPRTSPVPGFISQHAAPATPPLTPPPPPIPPRDRSPVKDVSSESSAPAAVLVSAATSITPQAEVLAPQYESDTEVSASLDISEELRVLDSKLKDVQAIPISGVLSHHNVRTPTPTPPPTPPPPSTQPPQTTTTPAPSPPPVRPVTPPAPVEEVVAVKEQQAVSAVVVPKESQSRSPQPWGDPDSPGPELNPNFEDPSDRVAAHSPPKPLVISVAVGTETMTEQRRSPSPQRRQRGEDPSELDSLSSPSSATDTFNDNISEGQWLVSRSEGQVAGLPLDNEVHRMAVEAARKVDTSTASTLRDTEDLDLDDTEDASRSEGEFLHRGGQDILLNPETDPVLALMLQMQRQPGGGGGFRQYDLPTTRVQHVLTASSSTNRSTGEVTWNGAGQGHHHGVGQGGVAVRKSVSEMSEGQVLYPGGGGGGGGGQVTVVAPKAASPPPPQDRDMRSRSGGEGRERRSVDRARSASPDKQHPTSTPQRSKTPPGSRSRQQQYQPVTSGLPPSHSRRPLKSALVRSSEDSRHSRDSERDSDRTGPPTEFGTRTLTPDQLNTEALLQSGPYMTKSMGSSGRQGSTKKSVEFDLTGTYEMTRRSYRSDDGFTSTAGSSDRLSGSGRSLGLRYSFEDTESERNVRSSSLRVSVTMPSAEGGSESDVSEIDVSENNNF
ncbi:uncharacterized protein LOC143281225 isoform X2 [Babylonia areolata]|uniref:uncharacterized protein LOC143281225 isoform X2 n=1 Tax=Babylonia areolata TaxID=304850 RepID=UPI003FD0411C